MSKERRVEISGRASAHEKPKSVRLFSPPSLSSLLPSSRFERSNDTKSPRRVTGHASSSLANEAIKRNEKEKRSEEEEEEEERRECAREIRNRRF